MDSEQTGAGGRPKGRNQPEQIVQRQNSARVQRSAAPPPGVMRDMSRMNSLAHGASSHAQGGGDVNSPLYSSRDRDCQTDFQMPPWVLPQGTGDKMNEARRQSFRELSDIPNQSHDSSHQSHTHYNHNAHASGGLPPATNIPRSSSRKSEEPKGAKTKGHESDKKKKKSQKSRYVPRYRFDF